MKNTCSFILCLAILSAAPAADAADRKDPALTINGVGLGTQLAKVHKVLGQPLSEVDEPPDDTMGMGEGKSLKYDGLILELCKPEGREDFHVWSVVVTSKKWVVAPGLRVGMSRETAIRVLGQPENVTQESGSARETLSYHFWSFDGFYGVTLEKGRVVEISAGEDWS